MTLAAALQARKAAPTYGPRCKVCAVLEVLDKQDRAALTDALADLSYTGVVISGALQAEGHEIRPSSITRHRRRECRGYEPR